MALVGLVLASGFLEASLQSTDLVADPIVWRHGLPLPELHEAFQLHSPTGLLPLAEQVWEHAVSVAADQSSLWNFSVFKVRDDKGNLLQEKVCKGNDAKNSHQYNS